ncbi:MAG: glycogen/starch/alpha-glucan phosphorylase [Candidatus Omnitrophota bacterium]
MQQSEHQLNWVQREHPELAGKTIVEVTMEMALSDSLQVLLERRLEEDASLSEGLRAEEMRKAAMATSVGGIGPLLKERIIAQADLGAEVIGVSLLYDRVWYQRLQEDGGLILEKTQVTPHLRAVLEHAADLNITLYDGQSVTVKTWRAPQGTYGAGTVYFLDIPQITDVIGGRANVAYPGRRDVSERAEESRLFQSWILGRGTLALLKVLNKRPNFVVMSEVASMCVHHRLFKDPFSEDPLFADTRYVFNDHTPLEYAHPYWRMDKLRRLKVDPYAYQCLPSWNGDGIDATVMIANVSEGIFGVSQKHGRVIRNMPLLAPFVEKIRAITNGVSPRYWPQDEFQDPDRLASLPNEAVLAVKNQRREKLVRQLAKRSGFGEGWISDALRHDRPVGLWVRRLVAYKRIERLADLLTDPAKKERFLKTGIILVFGGRMHQDDFYGPDQYRRLQGLIQDDPFLRGRILFFENYNIWEAPRLYQGADFSIVLADAGREAAATGFQKAQMNGALILGSEDGAVPESVIFDSEEKHEAANGFKVPYDNWGSPTAEGLLSAFEKFAEVFRNKDRLGQMVRNALDKAPRISVQRTAQEMLAYFAELTRQSVQEEAAYEKGRRMAHVFFEGMTLSEEEAKEILKQADAWAVPFTWKYQSGTVRERIVRESEPSLGGFVRSFQEIRKLGMVGSWCIAFCGQDPDDRGRFFAYLNLVLGNTPFLQPLQAELHRLFEPFMKVTDETRKAWVEANCAALGLVETLWKRLEAALGSGQAPSSSPS